MLMKTGCFGKQIINNVQVLIVVMKKYGQDQSERPVKNEKILLRNKKQQYAQFSH